MLRINKFATNIKHASSVLSPSVKCDDQSYDERLNIRPSLLYRQVFTHNSMHVILWITLNICPGLVAAECPHQDFVENNLCETCRGWREVNRYFYFNVYRIEAQSRGSSLGWLRSWLEDMTTSSSKILNIESLLHFLFNYQNPNYDNRQLCVRVCWIKRCKVAFNIFYRTS